MPDKRDSTLYSDIYTRLIDKATLTPEHRAHLKTQRGFSDTTIDRLKFRSCGSYLRDVVDVLTQEFDLDRMTEAGILLGGAVSPKLLTPNILIPFIDWTKDAVLFIRPHKDGLGGLAMLPYLPEPLQQFTLLTESEYKAAAAYQFGFSSIGIAGVAAVAGQHFESFVALLRAQSVTSLCILFDNEDKGTLGTTHYKPDYWDRWDTQYYAYRMARKLEEEGLDVSVAVLPEAWMENGKIDLDMALAQGKTRIDLLAVLRDRRGADGYLHSLPADARVLIERRVARSNLSIPIKRFYNKYSLIL